MPDPGLQEQHQEEEVLVEGGLGEQELGEQELGEQGGLEARRNKEGNGSE